MNYTSGQGKISERGRTIMDEAAELRLGALRMRMRENIPSALREAIAAHLEYMASRLAEHPKATGPATQGALRIARAA